MVDAVLITLELVTKICVQNKVIAFMLQISHVFGVIQCQAIMKITNNIEAVKIQIICKVIVWFICMWFLPLHVKFIYWPSTVLFCGSGAPAPEVSSER